VGWSQPAPQPQPTSVGGSAARNSSFSASRARTLELRIQQIAPARTMVAAPVTGTAEPATGNGQDGNASSTSAPPLVTSVPLQTLRQVATPPARSAPPRNSLQYVRTTNPAIERELVEAVVSQPQVRNRVEDSGTITALPGILRYTDNAGEEVQLKGFALTARRLVYDAAQRRYRGSIMLGLTDIVPGRPARQLSTPVNFQVIGAESATPAHVQINRTNPPYQEIELVLASARPVRVFSEVSQDPIEIDLPLEPALTIEAGSTAIDGLGIGTTQVNISLAGVDHPEGRVVTLRTAGGYLDPTLVRLDAQGSGSATLRSDGIGDARITASMPGLEPVDAAVDFRLPWLTFFACLAGGLVGGVIRARGRGRTLPMLVAALCGILVFAIYAVGIKVLPFTPSVSVGALLAFAISGLGGFGGSSLLHRLFPPSAAPGRAPAPAPAPGPAPSAA
jgi:hypothetical protein